MDASTSTALGIFDDRSEVAAAIEALKKAGFNDQEIGVASRELSRHFANVSAQEQHTAESGAIKGTIVGSGVGAILGLAGAAIVPGALPIVAGSLLVSAIVGGAAGAAAGVFAGPFIALGLSEADAQENARHVQEGKTVLLVYAPDRRDEAHHIMVKYGAYDDSMSTSP